MARMRRRGLARRAKQPISDREQAIQRLMNEPDYWSRYSYRDMVKESPILAPFPIRERRKIWDEVRRRENAETQAEHEARFFGGRHGR